MRYKQPSTSYSSVVAYACPKIKFEGIEKLHKAEPDAI